MCVCVFVCLSWLINYTPWKTSWAPFARQPRITQLGACRTADPWAPGG